MVRSHRAVRTVTATSTRPCVFPFERIERHFGLCTGGRTHDKKFRASSTTRSARAWASGRPPLPGGGLQKGQSQSLQKKTSGSGALYIFRRPFPWAQYCLALSLEAPPPHSHAPNRNQNIRRLRHSQSRRFPLSPQAIDSPHHRRRVGTPGATPLLPAAPRGSQLSPPHLASTPV